MLQLFLDRDRLGKLAAYKVSFENVAHRVFPADHKVLEKSSVGLEALCLLCVKHRLWEKQPSTKLERPFNKSSPAAQTLYNSIFDRSEWLQVIFRRDPKGIFFATTGHSRSKTHRAAFSDDMSVEVYYKEKPASISTLEEYISSHESAKEVFLPPCVTLCHVKSDKVQRNIIRGDNQRRGIRVQGGDQVLVSATTIHPELLSLIWIDADSEILRLKSVPELHDQGFRWTSNQHGEQVEIIVEPAVEMDDQEGYELIAAVVLRGIPSTASIACLEDALRGLAKSITKKPATRWFTHCYAEGSATRNLVGAHPAIEVDDDLKIISEGLYEHCRSFQIVSIPHLPDETDT